MRLKRVLVPPTLLALELGRMRHGKGGTGLRNLQQDIRQLSRGTASECQRLWHRCAPLPADWKDPFHALASSYRRLGCSKLGVSRELHIHCMLLYKGLGLTCAKDAFGSSPDQPDGCGEPSIRARDAQAKRPPCLLWSTRAFEYQPGGQGGSHDPHKPPSRSGTKLGQWAQEEVAVV